MDRDGPATAVLLAGKAKISVLATGMTLDFSHLMPLDLWRLAVAILPSFGPHTLAALLDSPALITQLPAVLPIFRFITRGRQLIPSLSLDKD
jgi:hypothetical protein